MEHLQSGGQWDTNASADPPSPVDDDPAISTWNTTSIRDKAIAVNPTSEDSFNDLDARSTSLTPWNTHSESLNSAEDPAFYGSESESTNHHRLSMSATIPAASKGKQRRHDFNPNMDMDSGLYWKAKYETIKMAFDTLSNQIGNNLNANHFESKFLPLHPHRIRTNVPPPQMIQPTDYPNFLNLTGMVDGGPSEIDRVFVPLNSPNLLNGLDYLAQEPVATSSADEQANPTFSMDSLNILEFSQSIDSASGTSASAGPAIAAIALTSESTVKNTRRLRLGKSKTARNLCATVWKGENPKGTYEEFGTYWKNLPTEEKLKYKRLEYDHEVLTATASDASGQKPATA